jgi:hypothetical protein
VELSFGGYLDAICSVAYSWDGNYHLEISRHHLLRLPGWDIDLSFRGLRVIRHHLLRLPGLDVDLSFRGLGAVSYHLLRLPGWGVELSFGIFWRYFIRWGS